MIEHWRALLRERPDDWRLALELKQALKAALHYPESDPLFRRAARSLPDDEWLAHYTALYAYHGEDLEYLDARARAMLARLPGDRRLLAVLGDVASQRRDWPGSAAAFAAAHDAHPNEEYRWKRDTAQMYCRLLDLLSLPLAGEGRGEGGCPSKTDASTSSPHPHPILSRQRERVSVAVLSAAAFINLDRNPERESELRRQFAGSAPPLIRSAGVEGRRLTAPAVRRLGGDPHMRGTLGCFLSHAGAWEAMVERGDTHCLFVEDDVIPLLDIPAALPLPPEAELVFVNDRIAPRLDPAAVTSFTIHPLNAAMTAFHPEDNAPGGDGYILSRDGARKLLAWVEADGFSDDVDWRLIAYGLTPAEIAALPRPSHAGPWLERISQAVNRPERLAAFVLHPPLIRAVGVSSDREDENRLNPSPS